MVDPAQTQLGKMLLDEITPVVMVLCTPQVEQLCQKNGLSFVDMLRPFSLFSNIDGLWMCIPLFIIWLLEFYALSLKCV